MDDRLTGSTLEQPCVPFDGRGFKADNNATVDKAITVSINLIFQCFKKYRWLLFTNR